MGGERDEALDEGANHAAQPEVAAVGAVEVLDVPAVLAVHPAPDARRERGDLGLEGHQVAGVDDRGAQVAEGRPQPPEERQVVAVLLVQVEDGDVVPLDAGGELVVVLEAHHRVPVTVGRHAVDQVHQAVFETPGAQREDHVGDQGWAAVGRLHGRFLTRWGPRVFATARGSRCQTLIARAYFGLWGFSWGSGTPGLSQ